MTGSFAWVMVLKNVKYAALSPAWASTKIPEVCASCASIPSYAPDNIRKNGALYCNDDCCSGTSSPTCYAIEEHAFKTVVDGLANKAINNNNDAILDLNVD